MTNLGTSQYHRNSRAYAINADGQAVGYESTDGGVPNAFFTSNGVITGIPSVSDANSYATSINNQGQVVGIAYGGIPGTSHAFVYSNGVTTDLGNIVGGTTSYASGINDSGQISGDRQPLNITEAFIYNNGAVINLGTLGGNNSHTTAINNNG